MRGGLIAGGRHPVQLLPLRRIRAVGLGVGQHGGGRLVFVQVVSGCGKGRDFHPDNFGFAQQVGRCDGLVVQHGGPVQGRQRNLTRSRNILGPQAPSLFGPGRISQVVQPVRFVSPTGARAFEMFKGCNPAGLVSGQLPRHLAHATGGGAQNCLGPVCVHGLDGRRGVASGQSQYSVHLGGRQGCGTGSSGR